MADFGVKGAAAARAGQGGGQRVAELAVSAEEGPERMFPQGPVRRRHVQHIDTFADRLGLSFAVCRVGEGQVCAGQGPEGFTARTRGQLALGEQGFFFRRKDVLRLAV